MQPDEVRPLDVPVRLFRLQVQIDRIGEVLVEHCDGGTTRRRVQVVTRLVHGFSLAFRRICQNIAIGVASRPPPDTAAIGTSASTLTVTFITVRNEVRYCPLLDIPATAPEPS